MSYKKKKNDSLLYVTFHSTIGEYLENGCSQWHIEFDEQDCNSPARIISLVFKAKKAPPTMSKTPQSRRPEHWWNTAPAEISGFCNATSSRRITAGEVNITVHVNKCPGYHDNDAHTGTPTELLNSTSYLLVEEYCPN